MNALLVESLVERAADLVTETEIGGAFVQQLPVLSAYEWLALRALQRARNQIRAEEAEKQTELSDDREQLASLRKSLGM